MRCSPSSFPLLAPILLASLSRLRRAEGVFVSRGGGVAGLPPSVELPISGGAGEGDGNQENQPPIGEVVGAGAVGVLAGQVVFQSLVISVGLGVASMSVAASSADAPGEIARSSGRMAVAVLDRVTQLNSRYQLTDRVVDGAKMAGWRLRKFDQEHAVVHRATQGTKKAWQDAQEFNEAHGVTARAGEAISSSLDKLTEVLTPPTSNKGNSERTSGREGESGGGGGGSSSSSSSSSSSDIYRGTGGSRTTKNSSERTNTEKISRSSSKRKKKRRDGKRRGGQRRQRGGISRRAGKVRRDWLLPTLDRDEAQRWLAEFRENGRRWIIDHEVLDA